MADSGTVSGSCLAPTINGRSLRVVMRRTSARAVANEPRTGHVWPLVTDATNWGTRRIEAQRHSLQ